MFLKEYEKIRLVGKGAFASVYKVRHAKYGYIRALKVCNDFIENEEDKAWDTFISECKVLLSIGNGSHPNIVHIYQPRLIDNRAMVEMDCVEGDSLHDYIKACRFIPFDEVLNFALQITDAVAYCHVDVYKFLMDPVADSLEPDPTDGRKFIISNQKESELIAKYGVVHNDLHSGNIIRRDYDGKYILLDFGLAIQDSHCVKSSSRFDGAIEYSAPEKLEHGNVSPRSDIYALGILMYEMLCGSVPFPYNVNDGVSPESARSKVYMQHLHEKPSAILERRRIAFEQAHPGEQYDIDYPAEFEAAIMKCLDKNPVNRFPNAKALLAAIRKCRREVVTPPAQSDASLKAELMALRNENQSYLQEINKLQTKIAQLTETLNEYKKQEKSVSDEKKPPISEDSDKDKKIKKSPAHNNPEDDNIPIVEVEIDQPNTGKKYHNWKSIFKSK